MKFHGGKWEREKGSNLSVHKVLMDNVVRYPLKSVCNEFRVGTIDR